MLRAVYKKKTNKQVASYSSLMLNVEHFIRFSSKQGEVDKENAPKMQLIFHN